MIDNLFDAGYFELRPIFASADQREPETMASACYSLGEDKRRRRLSPTQCDAALLVADAARLFDIFIGRFRC